MSDKTALKLSSFPRGKGQPNGLSRHDFGEATPDQRSCDRACARHAQLRCARSDVVVVGIAQVECAVQGVAENAYNVLTVYIKRDEHSRSFLIIMFPALRHILADD